MNSRGSKIADLSRTGLARLIDHTLLKPEATPADIAGLCRQAREYGFASVCVHPCYVPAAYELLSGSPVAVCTVVGFPLGANAPHRKAQEASPGRSGGRPRKWML